MEYDDSHWKTPKHQRYSKVSLRATITKIEGATRLDTRTTKGNVCKERPSSDLLAQVITVSLFTLLLIVAVATVSPTANDRVVPRPYAMIQWAPTTPLVIASTSTIISCNPTVVVNQASACTATVSNADLTSTTTPTGNVTFLATKLGSFSPTNSCKLAPGATSGTASCSTSFTPSVIGAATVTATYNGDFTHNTSSGPSNTITASKRSSTTGISCSSPALIGNPDTCNVVINDNSPGTPITPTGSFPLATNSSGIFGGRCSLLGTGPAANCSVSYTPNVSGHQQITASYPGDTNHTSSVSSATISVALHSTTTTAACSTVVVNQPTSCTATVTDASTIANSPTGTVTFTIDLLPNPMSCGLKSVSSGTSACSISVTPGTGTGGSHFVNVGYGADTSHSASSGTTFLNVEDYAITPSSTSAIVPVGSFKNVTFTLESQGGYSGQVVITWSVAQATGLTVACSPTSFLLALFPPTTVNCRFLLNTAGTYAVTISAASNGLTRQAIVSVQPPPDFSIVPSLSSISVEAGSTNATTLTLTSLFGLVGTIDLSTPSPIASLSPQAVNVSPMQPGGSTVTISAGPNVQAGHYSVTITGTYGSLPHSTVITVSVLNFQISPVSSTITVQAGIQKSDDVAASSLGGFQGTITLSLSAPSLSSASLNYYSVFLASDQKVSVTLSVSNVASGTFPVQITAASGNLAHSITLTVRVTDFNVTSASSTLSIQAGFSTSATITLTSLNDFAGSITMSSASSPSGPGLYFSQYQIPIVVNGTGSSQLTITLSPSLAPRDYNISITGNPGSGGISHRTIIIITVTRAPVPKISVPDSETGNPGVSLAFQVIATDSLTGDSMTLIAVSSTLPSGAVFNPVSGTGFVSGDFNWTPSQTQVGDFIVEFTATDHYGIVSHAWATIHISRANQSFLIPLGVSLPYVAAVLAGLGTFLVGRRALGLSRKKSIVAQPVDSGSSKR